MGKERIMSKMLRTHQNTIGNLAIALLFVGGCIFLLTGSWDTSESVAAKGCCGGDTTATSCCGGATTLVAETTGGCCGSTERVSAYDDEEGNNCNCLEPDNADADCGYCANGKCDDTVNKTCADACTVDSNCGPMGSKCNTFVVVCENGNTDFCSGDEDGCSN